MAEQLWVLGLSIDDQLSWAIAPVVPSRQAFKTAYPRLDFPHGKIGDFKQLSEGSPDQAIDIGQEVRKLIRFLMTTKLSDLLTQVVSIGVSTIGITDHRSNRLIDLRRKHVVRQGGDDYIVDFGHLFSDIFSDAVFKWRSNPKISVQNDATAKCLAYYRFQDELRKYRTLCLLNLSVGVDIGLANGFGPLASSLYHPELGHAYPFLEKADEAVDFASYGGCPVHERCYEGVLSTKRIEGQWHHKPGDLAPGHEAWPILASYVGQLCWIAALATSPDIIYLAGPTANDLLLREVHVKFEVLNQQMASKPYIRYSKERIKLAPCFKEKIRTNDTIKDISGIMGALELARLRIIRRDGRFSE